MIVANGSSSSSLVRLIPIVTHIESLPSQTGGPNKFSISIIVSVLVLSGLIDDVESELVSWCVRFTMNVSKRIETFYIQTPPYFNLAERRHKVILHFWKSHSGAIALQTWRKYIRTFTSKIVLLCVSRRKVVLSTWAFLTDYNTFTHRNSENFILKYNKTMIQDRVYSALSNFNSL